MESNISIKNYICKRFFDLDKMVKEKYYENHEYELDIKLDCVFCINNECDKDVAYENCPFKCLENVGELFEILMCYTHYYLNLTGSSEKEESKNIIDNMILYYFRMGNLQLSEDILGSFCFYADTHKICKNCSGTGIVVKWDDVVACTECNHGIKDFNNEDRVAINQIYLGIEYMIRKDLYTVNPIGYYEQYVVINKYNNIIVAVGDYKTIHKELHLPIFIDIEDYISKYKVYKLTDFNQKFEVVEKK